jgi:hypothetical protein
MVLRRSYESSVLNIWNIAQAERLTTVQGHYAQLFERTAPLAGEGGSLVFTGVEDDPETRRARRRTSGLMLCDIEEHHLLSFAK